jgi:hypothetical protein
VVGLHGGIFQRRENVSFYQEGIVLQDFLMGGPCAEQAENVSDTDALPPDARAPTAFAGLDSNSV